MSTGFAVRDVGVARAVDAGGVDMHLVAALGERAAEAVDRHDRPAIADRRSIRRHDVKQLHTARFRATQIMFFQSPGKRP